MGYAYGMVAYKSSRMGRTYHRINRFYPSSKTCSSCDYKLEKLDLGTREWVCPNCGVFHDRDVNAAKNILRVGQIDCYGEATTKSQATGDSELIIPRALQKMTDKIESSGIYLPVSHGSGQAARSLVMQQLTMNARIFENPRKNITMVVNSNGKANATHSQRLPASQHIITLINSEFG